MKVHYYADTDSLYIDLSEKVGSDSREISPGVVADFDEQGQIVGIDIDHASKVVNIKKIEMESLPLSNFSAI